MALDDSNGTFISAKMIIVAVTNPMRTNEALRVIIVTTTLVAGPRDGMGLSKSGIL